jgi:hypothetical protein
MPVPSLSPSVKGRGSVLPVCDERGNTVVALLQFQRRYYRNE